MVNIKLKIFRFFCLCLFGAVFGIWNLYLYKRCNNDFHLRFERLQGPYMAEDLTLIEILKDKYMDKPSSKEYKLSSDRFYKKSMNISSWPFIYYYTKHLLSNLPNGFFVEAGALDGEFLSNTLWLEKDLNWTGLLIEPDPYNYKELLTKNRKSWTSNACISSKPYAKKITLVSRRMEKFRRLQYNSWAYRGATHELGYFDEPFLEQFLTETSSTYLSVQCFPLLSYLRALNRTKIDFLSLDIQGTEPEVLKSFPFDQIDVHLMAVEHMKTPYYDPNFVKLVTGKGFEIIGCGGGPDYIFIKKDHLKYVNIKKRFECAF